ncbi:hypothetical protein [Streptomyces flaveolus]|uniref:hypothetical protein n=1 Tax=Streptomyces flaveolus TaxID=67297 RepID=UPI0033F892E0
MRFVEDSVGLQLAWLEPEVGEERLKGADGGGRSAGFESEVICVNVQPRPGRVEALGGFVVAL